MNPRKAIDLFESVDTLCMEGNRDALVTGIEYDSRSVTEGCMFAALPGIHTDGTAFIEQALRLGAKAIISEKPPRFPVKDALFVRVPEVRKALSRVSAAFYDFPSKKLVIMGVTGTDGKSTTVWLIHQILEALGYASGFLSTVEMKESSEVVKNPYRQSTPEAPHMHRILDGMVASGKEIAVIEATSHGLSRKTNRLDDVLFDVGILTNITHEHMEFHGSFEQYRSDKTELFRSLSHGAEKSLSDSLSRAERPFGVVNIHDPAFEYVKSQSGARLLSYGIDNPQADMYATDLNLSESGSTLTLNRGMLKSTTAVRLPGAYNVENILAACLAVSELLGIPVTKLSEILPRLSPVRGRMKEITKGQPFRVLVDYAHTPGAYERVFSMLRPLTRGRIIAVFGSAGERDVAKRPMQGRIASNYCDVLVLTDEDPRLEDREKILRDIFSGCERNTLGKDAFMEPDRRKAIRLAFETAGRGDTVILLGKGHEASIIYPDGPMAWDEIAVAEGILAEMGYSDKQ